jgi:regulator of protease activity HflC (stomatin/prohibitin superfamily)
MSEYCKKYKGKIWDDLCFRVLYKYFICLSGLIGIASIITFIIYLTYGVNIKVKQNEYGVVHSKFSTKLHGPMEQGVYNNLTIGDTLYKYTSTMQFLDFDGSDDLLENNYITCITDDGLIINLEVVVQYQYKRDKLISVIWYLFDDDKNYKDFIAKTIYGIIYENCAYFNANEYYSKRNIIEERLFDSVIRLFNNVNSGITVFSVQLKNIIFPVGFVNIISTKQHINQEIQTQLNNRTSLLISANTRYIQALQESQIIIIIARNNANIKEKNANMTANVIREKFVKLTDYLLNIQKQFNFTPEMLIDYLLSTYVKQGSIYASIH